MAMVMVSHDASDILKKCLSYAMEKKRKGKQTVVKYRTGRKSHHKSDNSPEPSIYGEFE